ncbi:unnamed protein product [Peniophora sp. CBMAI 1063]|nr:unnamed protein product [Peniophora sp. CBMAI 1063]
MGLMVFCATVAIAGGLYAAFRLGFSIRGNQYPPGPLGLPFVGNLLDMPRHRERETFSRWASQFGEIVHVNILGKHMILLNSARAVNDLLEKRASKYSDRPHFPLIDLAGQKFNFGFMPANKAWSSRRRTFAAQFGRSVPQIYPSHSAAVMKLLRNLQAKPEAFMDHIQFLAAQLILDVTYGITVDTYDHVLVRNAETLMGNVAIAVRPEMWIVNPLILYRLLPSWLGGDYLSMRMQKWKAEARAFREQPFRLASERSDGAHCFVNQLLDTRPSADSVETHEQFSMDCAAVAYGGGTDTVVVAARSFFLAMALNPEAQRKGQAEIDRFVGSGRLPDFNDREDLPFISAIVRETLRWNPPAPQGIPHLLTEDDVYKGYHLPKDSIVVGNIWHITHDPTIYTDPDEFEPNRHLQDGDLKGEDSARLSFGFGRRTCPGKAFAEDLLWLLVAQVLSIYDITQVKEGPPLRASFTSGTFSHPLPFHCHIKPRSRDAAFLISS